MIEKDWLCDNCANKWDCSLFILALNKKFDIKHCEYHMTAEENKKKLKALFGIDEDKE